MDNVSNLGREMMRNYGRECRAIKDLGSAALENMKLANSVFSNFAQNTLQSTLKGPEVIAGLTVAGGNAVADGAKTGFSEFIAGYNGEDKPGQVKEENSKEYVVKKGDTLWEIAEKKLGKDDKKLNRSDIREINDEIKKIAERNGIKDPDKIDVNQKLKL